MPNLREIVITSRSPNHDARTPGVPIDILLLHYTGMQSAEAALHRLCDPEAEVSAHYVIAEEGRIYQLVPEERRAWHAGASSWGRETNINARSIGIELVNPGHDWGYRVFPEPQMAALEELALAIVARYSIPGHRILGHSDVAPLRKQDPGELFDWARLARLGLGLWPESGFQALPHAPVLAAGSSGPAVLNLQIALDAIGYGIEGTGLYDPVTEAVVTAFQRHFRPSLVDGESDAETTSLVFHLAGRIPA